MRFKEYLHEQEKYSYPHASSSSKEEAIAWIKKNAKAHVASILRGGSPIWRGMSIGGRDMHPYGLGDGGKFVRKAANTYNFVNVIVSNSRRWKDYPKRESSYICSTDLVNANNFGEPYLVIPANDAPIGVVPTFDFWYGFKELDKMYNGGGVEVLAESLKVICDRLKMPINNDSTYAQLQDVLSKITKKDLESIAVDEGGQDAYDKAYSKRIEQLAEGMPSKQSLMDYLEDLLDPKESNFERATGATFNVSEKVEVWLGGQCAFIKLSDITGDDDVDGAEEKVREWLNAL